MVDIHADISTSILLVAGQATHGSRQTDRNSDCRCLHGHRPGRTFVVSRYERDPVMKRPDVSNHAMERTPKAFGVAHLVLVRRMSILSPVAASWSMFQRALIYIAAVGLSLLALRWLYVSVLTDYRSHHRPIMIPLALVTLALAFGLFRLSFVALVLLLALAAVVGASALYIQIFAAGFQPFLATVVAGATLYFCALVPRLTKCA
jgi:uncharacterized membrane protein